MAEHHNHASASPSEADIAESIRAGYEKEDVSLPVLIKWGAFLGVLLVATSAFALILFTALQRPPFGPPAHLGTFISTERPVPVVGIPILQDNPAGDPRPDNNPRKGIDNIREFRREEEIRMHEYAIQDGDIHIPIDRAMEIGLKNFEAQKPGSSPSGVSPTPEMKIHPVPPDTAPIRGPGVPGPVPRP